MITVLIHTRNEEKNIVSCIESARLLTESIEVIDMESTDKTIEYARAAGAHITSIPHARYVEPARAHAITTSPTPWVFILDADERMTPELAGEIKSLIATSNTPESPTHYRVPRKNVFNQKTWLKHGGWWPDHQMRFMKRDAFIEWPARIHATPSIAGSEAYTQNPIIHYFHGDVAGMVEKTILFEGIESDLLHAAGRPANVPIFFRKFYGEMWRRLIQKAGFLDGTHGILESLYQAFSKTITYLILYEKSLATKESPKRSHDAYNRH